MSPVLAGQWFFVWATWAVTLVALVGYAAAVLRRGRRLGRAVPPEERRWM